MFLDDPIKEFFILIVILNGDIMKMDIKYFLITFIMSTLERVISVLSLPIILLNVLSGIVSGIWLIILGEWTLLIIGIVLLFISQWIISLLLMLSLPLAYLAAKSFEKKNKFLAYIFGFLSQFYTGLLMFGSCIFAFFVCSYFYVGDTILGYMPYLLWSWGMALGTWQFFASKETDNIFSTISVFVTSVFYLLFLISVIIHPILSLVVIFIYVVVELMVLPIFYMGVAMKMTDQQTSNL